MNTLFTRRFLGQASLAATAGAILNSAGSASLAAPSAGNPTTMSPPVEAAWRDYQAVLEDCRQFIFTRNMSDLPEFNAQANEFFMLVQSAAYVWVMAPRMDYPRFFVNVLTEPNVWNWYLPCPDFRHRQAFVDGAQTYRIWGKRGNARFIDLQLGPTGAEEGDDKHPIVPYPFSKMHIEPDGSFEIIASPDRHDGNWIQLDPSQKRSFLLLREAFYDWPNETPARVRIERIATRAARPFLSDEQRIIENYAAAGRFLKFVVFNFSSLIFDLALKGGGNKTNVFGWLKAPDEQWQINRAAVYAQMVYEIGPDDALIIEGDVPSSWYWSLQLADRYSRSTDFTYHQSSLNGFQARPDMDGKFRMILSKTDPGVPNWLDPVDAIPMGLVYYRQYFQDKPAALPSVRKVPVHRVRDFLPPNTPHVSAQDRARALQDRAWGLLQLYGY